MNVKEYQKKKLAAFGEKLARLLLLLSIPLSLIVYNVGGEKPLDPALAALLRIDLIALALVFAPWQGYEALQSLKKKRACTREIELTAIAYRHPGKDSNLHVFVCPTAQLKTYEKKGQMWMLRDFSRITVRACRKRYPLGQSFTGYTIPSDPDYYSAKCGASMRDVLNARLTPVFIIAVFAFMAWLLT